MARHITVCFIGASTAGSVRGGKKEVKFYLARNDGDDPVWLAVTLARAAPAFMQLRGGEVGVDAICDAVEQSARALRKREGIHHLAESHFGDRCAGRDSNTHRASHRL